MKLKSTFQLLLGAFTLATAVPSQAAILTTTKYNNKTYHLDVLPSDSEADVWLRVNPKMCSAGDILLATVKRTTLKVAAKQAISKAASAVCTVKEVFDNGKTALGCASTAVSAACVIGSAPTGGLTALVCTTSLSYTLNKGAKDCFYGVSNKVASYLAGEKTWAAAATAYNVKVKDWDDAIDHAIDYACTMTK